jgi:FdrA protein
VRHVEARAGLYRDSVRLMQISSTLSAQPAVRSALVAMATKPNLELLAGMGFAAPGSAGPNDMLVAIATTDDDAMASALDLLEAELSDPGPPPAGTGGAVPSRTTFSAATGATLALVSTPGRYAFVEAMDALDAGLSVMVFSDNVPLAQEVRLKEVAVRRGLLVMGPECGTAVVGGVGLGFANVVRPGPVGLVAASGTGAQHVMSLLSVASVGISHCLGLGGRDMSAAVGGLSAHVALDALDADADTQIIVVIGKPPAPSVEAAVRAHAARLGTPVIHAPVGAGRPDLTAAVEEVLARLGVPAPDWPSWRPTTAPGHATPGHASPGHATPGHASPGHASPAKQRGIVRGLFGGGTLCAEAAAIVSAALGPVDHMLDLGADEYTAGRPHPMIDLGPRQALLASWAGEPECRVLMLDVVLGHAAHPDPASELAPTVLKALAARDGTLSVVVSLVGTPDDPQNLPHQAETLRDAGAWVHLSNADGARQAVRLASGATPW